MADSDALIKIGVDIPASETIIKGDLETIAKRINSEKPTPLQIVGSLEPSNTEKEIQAQLNNISKNLNLNLGVNVGNIGKQVKESINKASKTTTQAKVTPEINVESISASIKKAFSISKSDMEGIRPLVQDYVNALKLTPNDSNAIKTSYEAIFDEVSGTSKIDPDKIGWDKFEVKLKECVQVSTEASQVTKKTVESLDNESKAVKRQIEDYNNLKLAKENIVTDANGNLINRSNTYKGNGVTETQNYNETDTLTSISYTKNFEEISKSSAKANVEATKLYTTLNNIQGRINDKNASKPITDEGHLSTLNSQYANVENAINAVQNADNTTMAQMKANANAEISKLREMEREFRNAETAATSLRTLDIGTIKEINTNKIEELVAKIKGSKVPFEQLQGDVDNLRNSLSNVVDKEGLTKFLNQLDITKSKFSQMNAFEKQAQDAEKLELKTKNLIVQIRAYQQLNQNAMQSNSKNSDGFTYKQQLDEYITTLQKAGGVTKEEFAKIQLGFRNVTTEIRGMGLQGNTFLGNVIDKLKKFAGWMGITTIISSAVRGIRNMINEVVELDTALVDLKKTSDATESQLKNFYYTANDTAKALGVSTVAVVQTTSEWSRLGFSISEATKLAENSAIFKAISPEMTTEQATDGLVASIKAYGIGAEDTLDGIISKVNVLGNKFAVNNQDVIEVITRSASAMASANNSFEQTAALGVAATEITRDSASVGTALKTISMRVRAMDEETEQYDETLKSIKGDIFDLTGVSIMSDADTYRSTYDILKDISLVWDNLTDKARAQTLESLFGKRQANIGSAILSNFESAERALDEMSNSQGGALKEMEIIYDSIDYKANRFKETLTGIAQSSITQDFLKNTIDLGTGLLEILNKLIDKLGIVPTLISAITVGIGAKNAFSGTGRAKYDCPYKYARISSGGNTERVYAKMVA